MKTKYYYEEHMTAEEVSVVKATVESAEKYNAEQKYYEDEHTLWDHFEYDKDAILKACNLKEENVSEHNIEHLLACETIKMAIERSPDADEWKFLLNKGIIDIDTGKEYASIIVNHPHLDDLPCIFSIEPEEYCGLLSDESKILVWDENECIHEDDIDRAIENAFSVIDGASYRRVEEREFNDEKVIDDNEEYKNHLDKSEQDVKKVSINKVEFSKAINGDKKPVHILGSANITVEGNKFTTAWKYEAQEGKLANPDENQIVIGLTKSKSLTLIDYRTGEAHDDQTLNLSDESKAKMSAMIVKKLSNNAEIIQSLTSTLSNAIPSSKNETGAKFKLDEEAISRLNKVAEVTKEQSKNRLKNKI